MRRTTVSVVVIAFALALTGCSGYAQQTVSEVEEIAEARDVCVAHDGTFRQWQDGFNNQRWYCDFDDQKGRADD